MTVDDWNAAINAALEPVNRLLVTLRLQDNAGSRLRADAAEQLHREIAAMLIEGDHDGPRP